MDLCVGTLMEAGQKAQNGPGTGQPALPETGVPSDLERLFPLVYEELRRLARSRLRSERDGHTLDTTGLVHETYLRLAAREPVGYNSRAHVLAVAARAMRQILVDYARRYRSLKRGAGASPIRLREELAGREDRAERILAVDEALTRLLGLNERLARVVECRYFAGLSEEETAEALGVTPRTVRRDWVKAKGWLYQELRE